MRFYIANPLYIIPYSKISIFSSVSPKISLTPIIFPPAAYLFGMTSCILQHPTSGPGDLNRPIHGTTTAMLHLLSHTKAQPARRSVLSPRRCQVYDYNKAFSPHRKENTTLQHYKVLLVNAVWGKNRCSF
jgi:hypothetical protein